MLEYNILDGLDSSLTRHVASIGDTHEPSRTAGAWLGWAGVSPEGAGVPTLSFPQGPHRQTPSEGSCVASPRKLQLRRHLAYAHDGPACDHKEPDDDSACSLPLMRPTFKRAERNLHRACDHTDKGVFERSMRWVSGQGQKPGRVTPKHANTTCSGFYCINAQSRLLRCDAMRLCSCWS